MFCDNFLWTLFTFLCGVVAGICLVAALVWYVLSFFFHQPEKKDNENLHAKPQSSTFQLPPVLLSKISDESCKSKESCWALNFILYFLFRELRNSEGIRRWILRKLSLEFDELLASSVLGKFFSSISIQNVELGQNFPVVNWLKTSKVELHPVFKSISTLDILVDLDYAGGFQFSIQAETHLKHSAFLAVQFKGIKGQARLQFAIDPYAHWSFSFAENPDIDISVVSQLYGKSFSQITSIISSQLKRSVRKKHTLPMFKIRYKPFFTRVENIIAALVPDAAPKVENKGVLTVTVLECRGLMPTLLQGSMHTTISIGDFDWIAAYMDDSGSAYVIRDIACVKTARREANLDFTLTQVSETPVVESLTSASSSHSGAALFLDFEPGDEVIAVDGKKVTTVKQCVKNFRNSSSMKVIWRIKRRYPVVLHAEDITAASAVAAAIAGIGSSTMTTSGVTNASKVKVDNGNENTSSVSPALSRRNSFSQLPPTDTGENANCGIGPSSFPVENDEARRTSFSFRLSSSDNRIHQVMHTADVLSTQDPIFEESFNVNVENSSRYLNLSVWTSGTGNAEGSSSSSPTSSPSKRSKSATAALDLMVFGGNKIVGTLSLPLADIVSECSATGMGFFVKDFYLGSPDGIAAEAREHGLKDHSGFEPNMCYGKVSLSFLFKSNEDISKRKDSMDSLSSTSTIPTEVGAEVLPVQNNLSPTEEPSTHQFMKTHFRSATVCDYCNKKIWLKEAYTCRICNMKCHKKCNERCMANTVCRGEGYYCAQPNTHVNQGGQSGTPEIVTTESEPNPDYGNYDDEQHSPEKGSYSDNSLQPNAASNTVRRRTLGGLIVSAVQHRSAQLRRAGSATTLLTPNHNSNSISKSLPPSPQASPTVSRKASVTAGNSGMWSSNPFEVLDAGGLGSSEEDLNAAVEHLIQNPNDDLVAVAKETGRDVFGDLSIPERKHKLNHVLNRLQEEIDTVSNERMQLSREESQLPPSSRGPVSLQIARCEERTQALALLMLHYCSGLQHVQDLEENDKEEILVRTSSSKDLVDNGSNLSGSDNSDQGLSLQDLPQANQSPNIQHNQAITVDNEQNASNLDINSPLPTTPEKINK